MSLSLDYYFHYTSFCLNSHFLRHLTSRSLTRLDTFAIQRSIDSAISILQLSHNLGPASRDQLRYLPGFLFVTLSFCCSFILQTVKTFPGVLSEPDNMIELVRKTAGFMIELGADRSHGAGAVGETLLRQLDNTMQNVPQRRFRTRQAMAGNAADNLEIGRAHV